MVLITILTLQTASLIMLENTEENTQEKPRRSVMQPDTKESDTKLIEFL